MSNSIRTHRGRRAAPPNAWILAGLCAGVLVHLLWGGVALAGDDGDERLNRIEFQVSVDRPVDNDLARAVLAVERENVDPAVLAQDVNRAMAAALGEARGRPGIDVRSGNYRTSPVHDEGRIVRWRASQELILEGTDPEALHGLAGSLQEGLVLRSLGYTVSPERRRAVEAALLAEALEAFRERARLVVDGLGSDGYDIVRLHLQEQGMTPPAPLFARTMAMADSAAVAGEAGTSRLGFGVNAVIRLRD